MSTIRLLAEPEVTAPAGVRPLLFEIKEKSQLYSFYMPFLKNGGLFVPHKNHMAPNAKISLILTLPSDPVKKTVMGKVCWITPPEALMGVIQGVGVHFDDNEQNRLLKIQIENLLGGILGHSETRTMTI